MDLIKEALARGESALSEYDAKRFLSSFGIPVVHEAIAPDADSAAAEATKIGFPVVLKVSGERLLHKTEVGGIALDLRNEDEVRAESARLLKIPGCQGLLVQELVKGVRELACGLTRDSEFGPCVMFGLGGILTEVLEDVVFRIAPLTAWDAQEMIEEIRSKKIVEPFRGEAGVDRDALTHILVVLGEIGLQREDVREIDVNPLKIRSDGKPVSVDALVGLETGGESPS